MEPPQAVMTVAEPRPQAAAEPPQAVAEPQAAEPQAAEPMAAEPQAAQPQVAQPQVALPVRAAQQESAEFPTMMPGAGAAFNSAHLHYSATESASTA